MRIAHLKRGYNAQDVTLGMLQIEGANLPPIYTLEEPWKENRRGVSCIPVGTYICHPHDGLKFREVWQLANVPDRSAILIHSGNTTLDIEGCILVGFMHGTYQHLPAVLDSRKALVALRNEIGVKESFKLIIS